MATLFKVPPTHHICIGATWVLEGDKDHAGDKEPNIRDIPLCPFADSEPKLQQLWKEALSHNKRYWLLQNMVCNRARQIPSYWGLLISISECSIDEGQQLL
jgi:hypothetical protein